MTNAGQPVISDFIWRDMCSNPFPITLFLKFRYPPQKGERNGSLLSAMNLSGRDSIWKWEAESEPVLSLSWFVFETRSHHVALAGLELREPLVQGLEVCATMPCPFLLNEQLWVRDRWRGWSWRDGSDVKSTGCSPEDLSLILFLIKENS